MTVPYFKLINVLQGKTARWIEGETEAHGLYTDEITTCRIVCFFGKKGLKKAISMTHFDGYIDLAELKSEYDWFDEVTHFFIFYNLKEYRAKPELFKYFNEIFKGQITKVFENKNCQFIAMDNNSDAIRVLYNPNENFKLDIGWVNSEEFSRLKLVLVNHPNAASIYAYYKTNIMCSEIEGEFKYLTLWYNRELERVAGESRSYIYEGKVQHVTEICKKLSTKLVTQRLMFDGKSFQNPGTHDFSLSNYAKFIFDALKENNSNEFKEFEEFKVILAAHLTDLECKNFPYGHEPRYWFEDDQTKYIALNYLYALKLHVTIELPGQYMNMIDRYSYKFNCAREIELIKEAVFNLLGRECHSSNDESGAFFSFSQFATKKQPYGPYADYLCSEGDYADKLTKLSMAIDR